MAKAASGAVLALAATFALSGCGTIGNLAGNESVASYMLDPINRLSPEARIYGGVAGDVSVWELMPGTRPGSYLWPLGAVLASFTMLDLPLSAVGDTLTLPLTAYAEWKRLNADAKPPSDSPPDDYPRPTNGSTSGRSDSSRPQNTGSIPNS